MKVKPRKAAILGVAVAALGFGLAVPGAAQAATVNAPNPPRVTMPAGTNCPPIILYAVRGSNEAFDDGTLGAGQQIKALYDRLRLQYGADNVGLIANGYVSPTLSLVELFTDTFGVAQYGPRVKQGALDVQADITTVFDQCGNDGSDHTLLAVGYSAGADALRRGLAQVDGAKRPTNIVTQAYLLGDPNFNPAEDWSFGSLTQVMMHGDFNPTTQGWWLKHKHLRALTGLSYPPPAMNYYFYPHSWCAARDMFCQNSSASDAIAQHMSYGAVYSFAMANQAWGVAPTLLPTTSPYIEPAPLTYGGPPHSVVIEPNYSPPTGGANAGTPLSTTITVQLDGSAIGSPTIDATTRFYGVVMPDKKWHLLTVDWPGQGLLEKRFVKAS